MRQGKELIQWKSVDDEERWVDLAIAMHEGAVPAKLMALYTIPKEGLTDTARAAMALRDEQVCVQSYHAALEAITEEQITELQRTMKCVGADMQTLEGLGDHHQLAVAQEVQRMAKGEGSKVIGNKHLQVGGEQSTHQAWKKHIANVARMAGFVAKKPEADKPPNKKPAVEPEDERDIYIQRLLDEQAELVTQLEEQKNKRQTRASPSKEELTAKLKQAEKAAAKAQKDQQKERLRQQLAEMEEDSSESEDETDRLMRLLQSKKEKHKAKDQDQAGDVGKKKGSEKEKETDMRRMIRNLKRKREPDEDEEDSEDNKYVDITEE